MEEEINISVWNGVINYLKCLTGDIRLIIIGEKHSDSKICQFELIKNVNPEYVLSENIGALKDACKNINIEPCDLSEEEKKDIQKELLKLYLPHKYNELITCHLRVCPYSESSCVDRFFDSCSKEHKCLNQKFRGKREKKMGEITINRLRESSKPIIVIIGHDHAMESSMIHYVLKEISYITIWKDGAYCKKCNFRIGESDMCPICETKKDKYLHMKIYTP
jgi:hypothetical protein